MTTNANTKNKDYLSDGLVMKGVKRIESIRTRYEERMEVNIQTWQCSRLIRRDFNILTSKMYLSKRHSNVSQKISKYLHRLERIAKDIESLANCHPQQFIATKNASIQLRVISSDAKKLINIIIKVDAALCVIGTHKTMDEMGEISHEFFSCFDKLKRCALQTTTEPKKKTNSVGTEFGSNRTSQLSLDSLLLEKNSYFLFRDGIQRMLRSVTEVFHMSVSKVIRSIGAD